MKGRYKYVPMDNHKPFKHQWGYITWAFLMSALGPKTLVQVCDFIVRRIDAHLLKKEKLLNALCEGRLRSRKTIFGRTKFEVADDD